MSFPGCSALFKSGIVEQALLGQNIVQPDVPCPAQVGACAISADQPRILCCRGIVWCIDQSSLTCSLRQL